MRQNKIWSTTVTKHSSTNKQISPEQSTKCESVLHAQYEKLQKHDTDQFFVGVGGYRVIFKRTDDVTTLCVLKSALTHSN